MLLTAANLEQLAQIHKKTPILQREQSNRLTYNTNITLNNSRTDNNGSERAANDTIISIDHHMIQHHLQQQRLQNKTKDVDAMSMASSTHFTMVNGVGGPQRAIKDGICSRGHQITVLILTMSVIFLIGICGAVFMLERKYPDIKDMFEYKYGNGVKYTSIK